METYLLAGGLVCALLASFTDVRSGRIPNRLAYGALMLGLAVRTVVGGRSGLMEGLLGTVICGGIFLVLFIVGGMGGGDVKLMAAIGCWAGIGPNSQNMGVKTLEATAIAGGVMAVGYMIFYRRTSDTFRNMGSLLRFHLTSGLRSHPEINVKAEGAVKIPYALAMAIGTIYAMGLLLLGR